MLNKQCSIFKDAESGCCSTRVRQLAERKLNSNDVVGLIKKVVKRVKKVKCVNGLYDIFDSFEFLINHKFLN